jgi:regulator of sigma E protease
MFATILKVALLFIEVLLIFNVIIIVHELGHFLAARWRGLVVDRFGVWFGKPIWRRTYNGVEYSLGCIPAGGFVALPQMAAMESIEGKNRVEGAHLPPASALDKMIVAFAGPLFSMGLAVLIACFVWIVGKPVMESERTTVIGHVEPGSPAEKAGLQPGDQILEVEGHPVKRFAGAVDSVTWYVVRSEGDTIAFKIRRGNEVLTLHSGWTKEKVGRFQRASLRQVMIAPRSSTVIEAVESGTPAAAGGLQPGDEILAVNGLPIYSTDVLSNTITASPDKPVQLRFRRGAEEKEVSVLPAMLASKDGKTSPRIGIRWSPNVETMHFTPVQQIVDSVLSMRNMIGALLSPKSDVKAQHFSGPAGIMNLYYRMLQLDWRLAVAFSVFFNVNLALLNLIPLPVLDGGHILLATIEAIRRKPVNARVVEWINSACAFALMAFMLYVTFFDVQDLPFMQRDEPAPAAQATPK